MEVTRRDIVGTAVVNLGAALGIPGATILDERVRHFLGLAWADLEMAGEIANACLVREVLESRAVLSLLAGVVSQLRRKYEL